MTDKGITENIKNLGRMEVYSGLPDQLADWTREVNLDGLSVSERFIADQVLDQFFVIACKRIEQNMIAIKDVQ